MYISHFMVSSMSKSWSMIVICCHVWCSHLVHTISCFKAMDVNTPCNLGLQHATRKKRCGNYTNYGYHGRCYHYSTACGR